MALYYIPVRAIRCLKMCAIFVPIVLFWIFGFALIIVVDNRDKMDDDRQRVYDLRWSLDKSSACDAILDQNSSRLLLSANDTITSRNKNKTFAEIVEVCRQLDVDRRNYFRRRPTKVNVFDRSIVLSADGACDAETYLVVIVHSLHSYRSRRDAIRRTWGGAARNRTWPGETLNRNVRVVFIFGRSADAAAEADLRKESATFGDVVQGDFAESYRNMTLKSLLGLKWVLERCPSINYLFKCDDDMFVNVPAILRIMETTLTPRSIVGPLNPRSPVYRTGKWAVDKVQYPFTYYPPYESGSGYAISADLVRPLLETSEYVPHLFVDDVYVTGILGKILNVNHVRQDGFAYWTSKTPTVQQILCDKSVLTGTKVSPDDQYKLWNSLTVGVNCTTTNNPQTASVIQPTKV